MVFFVRVRRGVYYGSEENPIRREQAGTRSRDVAFARASWHCYAPTGTAAYNGLGLTTQNLLKVTYRRTGRHVLGPRGVTSNKIRTISPLMKSKDLVRPNLQRSMR